MHHLLFADQESLGVIPWVRLAADAGVSDLKDFERCLSSDLVRNAVQADAAAAKQLGARGTPAVIVVGGAQFAGVPSKRVMDSLLLAVSSKIKNATTK